MKTPYDRAWWVEDGVLLGGCYPGSTRTDTAERKLRGLLDAGVRTIVSLMEADETNEAGHPFGGYEPLFLALARESGIEIELHRFPIPDFGIVGPETIRTILDTINDSIARDRPVYLHCWGGHGRTGMIVGCWLREAGLGGDQALERIIELRQHSDYLRNMEAPQTDEQRAVVYDWQAPPQ